MALSPTRVSPEPCSAPRTATTEVPRPRPDADPLSAVPPLCEDTLTDAALVSVTEAARAGHQGFADHWRTIAPTATRARRWCQRHRRDLLAAAS
jgi:hypothetical protein